MKQYFSKENSKKPIVAMYYSFSDKIGGPLTYINTLMNSELKEEVDFRTLFQNKAPKGINLSLLREMVRQLKEMKPDIVHVHGVQSEGFYGVLAARLAGCRRIVLTVHGFAFDDSHCKGVKHFLYYHFVEPYAIRHADKVYCVCEFAANRDIVRQNIKNTNCGTIYNPVPVLKPEHTRAEVRKELGIADDDVVFAFSGRVTKEKGLDIIAQTVELLRKRNVTSYRVVIIGDGGYMQTFKEQTSAAIADGNVILIGRSDHVADYLFASDVFLFPSYHENLSIALLEAGSAGLPCIVYDAGGNAEIVKNEQTGFVVKEQNPEKYADCMEMMIRDSAKRTEMGVKIREDIHERFSLKVICKQVQEVYREWSE